MARWSICGLVSVPETGIWTDWPFRPESRGSLATQASWMGISIVRRNGFVEADGALRAEDDVADLEFHFLVIDAAIGDLEVHLLVAD